jgi:hypothetical protein
MKSVYARRILLALLLATPLSAQGWVPTGNMQIPRGGAATALLADGTVLFAGGGNYLANGDGEYVLAAEIYNPKSGTFSLTGPPNYPRSGAAAARLPDGKVLIVGGECINCATAAPPPEIYDPATGSFTVVAGAPAAIEGTNTPQATLLSTGKVLITGGVGGAAYLFDPSTDSFLPAGAEFACSNFHQILLPNGDVLVDGGHQCDEISVDDGPPQVYHTATGQWETLSGPGGYEALLLSNMPNGKVLVAGAGDRWSDFGLAWRYDPASETFASAVAPLWGAGGSAFLLPSGHVLNNTAVGELYDPASGTWSEAGVDYTGGVQLADGRVLVVGVDASKGYPGTPYALIFDENKQEFSLNTPNAYQITTIPTGYASYAVSSQALGGYTGAIQLTCQVADDPVATCSFDHSQIQAGQGATLSVALVSSGANLLIYGRSSSRIASSRERRSRTRSTCRTSSSRTRRRRAGASA